MQQFLNVFAELKGKKFYLTGESVRSLCSDINFSPIFLFSVRWDILAKSVSSLGVRYPFTLLVLRYCRLYVFAPRSP